MYIYMEHNITPIQGLIYLLTKSPRRISVKTVTSWCSISVFVEIRQRDKTEIETTI